MATAYIYDAIRTPRGRGRQGGSLYEVKPVDLVVNLLEALRRRHDLDTTRVEDFILATGEPVDEQGQNLAKTALIYSSWDDVTTGAQLRSEEHTSELQSRGHLVCRLLLEKKNKKS